MCSASFFFFFSEVDHPQVSSCVSSRMCHAVEASCTNHCHTTQRVTPLGGAGTRKRPCRTGGTVNRLLFFNLGGVTL